MRSRQESHIMPMIQTPGQGLPARVLLRAVMIGALCAAAISPLSDGGPPVPRRELAGRASVFSEEPSEAARVTLGPGGRDIRLAGDLTEGVAARVAALLATNPRVERLHLTSDGGLVDEAMALGALVARRHLVTYVPDACASACTLVFVHGRARYLAVGGQLGFHAPYELGPGGRMEAVDPDVERAAYLAAGVAPDFVAQTMTVAPKDIWVPEPTRLRAAGVVTGMVGTDRFPDSTLDADSSPQAARAEILHNVPIFATADPASVDAAVAWYRDGYLAGRTEAEALAGLRRRATTELRRQVRSADDATLHALGLVILADTTDADICAAVAQGDLVTLDETLRRARPGSPGLAPLRAGRSIEAQTHAVVGFESKGTARPGRPVVSSICTGPITAIRRALERALHQAAHAIRAVLMGERSAKIASAAAQ